ncbi:MAG: glycosyltransferase family 4 protein [Lachnospiraceae bacterium]|nr:glycosyltransferase family 4 protein [Lachnospiraceae bacterium]
MESFGEPGYGMACTLRAINRKLRVVSWKEKCKLLLKLLLRPFGVKRNLFLGGYYLEEDEAQQEQDEQIYLKWKSEEVAKLPGTHQTVTRREAVATNEERQQTSCISTIKDLLKERDSYLALAVQKLDRGGLEEVVRWLAMEMQKQGIPLKIFCIESGGEIAEDLRKAGIEVLLFDGRRERLEEYCRAHRPWLVNSHYVLDFLEVFRQFSIPVVEVIHNMYVFLDEAGMELERQKRLSINRYIAVSGRAKEVFCHKFPDVEEDRITVIGNALRGKRQIHRSREQVRETLGISQDAYVYLTVGSVDARKNQLGILRGWDIFRKLVQEPVALVVAGGGTDYEYEYKIKAFLADRELQDSVFFIGHSNEVEELLHASDVFVLDSYYEGWSMAATEALGCGVPIIHSDCGSGAELTAGGSCGILIDNPLAQIEAYDRMVLYNKMHAGVNENMEQFVAALLEMHKQREYWRGQREAIRAYAERNFAGETALERYLEVFLKAQNDKERSKTNEQSRNRNY